MGSLIKKLENLRKKNEVRKIDSSNELSRIIKLNDADSNALHNYPDNFLKTSKYEPLTFVCINLYSQFRRTANFYFLGMNVLMFLLKYKFYISINESAHNFNNKITLYVY